MLANSRIIKVAEYHSAPYLTSASKPVAAAEPLESTIDVNQSVSSCSYSFWKMFLLWQRSFLRSVCTANHASRVNVYEHFRTYASNFFSVNKPLSQNLKCNIICKNICAIVSGTWQKFFFLLNYNVNKCIQYQEVHFELYHVQQ